MLHVFLLKLQSFVSAKTNTASFILASPIHSKELGTEEVFWRFPFCWAVCGIFGTKSCLLMTRFLTHCPLHSFSHPTQHARQQKPFPVVLEQNDGFLNFGVEKFYSHDWYFLHPKSFLEYEWSILKVENIFI